jgi:hypothetical protein
MFLTNQCIRNTRHLIADCNLKQNKWPNQNKAIRRKDRSNIYCFACESWKCKYTNATALHEKT